MRILMTTDTVGGVWNFTSTLTEQLLERGHAIHLVSFGRSPSPEQHAWATRLQDKASTTLQAFNPSRNLNPLQHRRHSEPREGSRHSAYTPGNTPLTYTPTDIPLEWMQDNEHAFTAGAALLTSLTNQHHPDLLFTNQFCFGALGTPIPRIVAAHSDVLSWAQACRGQALAPSPWLTRYTDMVTAGLRAATAVVAPTFTMASALVNHFPVPHGVEVIPNGAQVTPLATQPKRKLQAITAGRLWDEGKGLDILQNLQSPMPLLVAGDNAFETTSIPSQHTSLGPLSQPDLHQCFRESAIYLCTSRYEPFGLAPLEAALCGCALVLRDIPSLREIWQGDALYFTDQPSLTRTLTQLATQPDTLAAFQHRAQTRARDFTPERMTDNYLALFHSVLPKSEAQHHAA